MRSDGKILDGLVRDFQEGRTGRYTSAPSSHTSCQTESGGMMMEVRLNGAILCRVYASSAQISDNN